jgi:OPA family sugar phosphate sensor protein UhpC-like MFS transporter
VLLACARAARTMAAVRTAGEQFALASWVAGVQALSSTSIACGEGATGGNGAQRKPLQRCSASTAARMRFAGTLDATSDTCNSDKVRLGVADARHLELAFGVHVMETETLVRSAAAAGSRCPLQPLLLQTHSTRFEHRSMALNPRWMMPFTAPRNRSRSLGCAPSRRCRLVCAGVDDPIGKRARQEDAFSASIPGSRLDGERQQSSSNVSSDGSALAYTGASSAVVLEGANPQLDAKYRHWRVRVFYSIFLGYAFFYFTRNSFTYTAPALRAALGLSLEQLGVIMSVFPLAYGFSKLFLGIAADRFSSRVFMALGISLTGLVNIFFGLQSNVYAMTALWFLNGIFQGSGAAPCAKLLTRWYSKNERGTWWGLWNTSHNTGGFFIPLIVGYSVKRFGWRYGMIVPGVLGILMGIFLLNRLRDCPEEVGLPPIEIYRDDHAEDVQRRSTAATRSTSPNGAAPGSSSSPANAETPKTAGKSASAREQAATNKFLEVIGNPYVLLLAISYFFIYFCRQGISSWTVIYLTSMGVPPQEAALRVGSMEIGGLCGSLVSGAVSDRLARGRRIPVILFWMLGVVAALVAMWLSPASRRYLSMLCIFTFGFFIYGPQMLVGLAASEMVSPDSVSSTIGFLGWIAYIGAATSGYPLTRIVSALGWDAYFAALICCACIAILLLLPMWRIGERQAKAIARKWRALVAGAAANFQALHVQDDGQYVDCEACAGAGTRLRMECGPATPAQTVSCKLVETPCEKCFGTGSIRLPAEDATR